MPYNRMFVTFSPLKSMLFVAVSALAGCGGGGGGGGTVGDTVTATNCDSISSSNISSTSAANTIGASANYSVGGSISIPAFTVIDSDVNDTTHAAVSNSDFDLAQSVPNPANIGGYVNAPGQGCSGNSLATGDQDDYYSVSLKQGQVIRLNIANYSNQNLDLALYNSSRILAAASTSTTSSLETVTVPSDGDYFINVYAVNSASNYILSVGLAQTSAVANAVANRSGALNLSVDFEPLKMVVKYTDEAQLGTNNTAVDMANGFQATTTSVSNRVRMFAVSKNETPRISSSAELANEQYLERKIAQGTSVEQRQKLETLYAISAMRENEDVEYAEPSYILKPFLTPNDTYYDEQWHYPMINLSSAWDISTGSQSVIVAVIDTGIYLAHTDLAGQLISGYDFISSAQIAGDGDGIDSDPNDVGDGGASGSSSFHGTHVAGTIGAKTNNGTGVAGVNWLTSIMPIRVLGIGGGTDYDVAQGIRYAAGLANDSGTVPAQRADIINMSLGGTGYSQTLADAVSDASAAGVIIVAAAGNDGSSQDNYPAALPGVISVSAVDAAKNLAPYSSYGSTVDVAAPGGDISADLAGDGHADGVLSTLSSDSGGSLVGYYQGTSMAAPHVAGVIGLMKAVNPGLTPNSIDVLLANGVLTDDIGSAGKDTSFGHGLIDARKAVVAAGGSSGNAPALSVYPTSINFGVTLTSFDLTLDKSAEGSLTISNVTDNVSWLSVTPNSVDADGLGTYTVQVNRNSLSDDIYRAEITAVSSNGTQIIEVLMQVTSASVVGEVGASYVLLIDPATDVVVRQFDSTNPSGSFNFSFDSVPQGSYQLIVGTDMDNDGYICDNGEACGGYPTLNSLETFTVNSNTSGLNFTITFADTSLISLGTDGDVSDQSVFNLPFITSGKGLKLKQQDTAAPEAANSFKQVNN